MNDLLAGHMIGELLARPSCLMMTNGQLVRRVISWVIISAHRYLENREDSALLPNAESWDVAGSHVGLMNMNLQKSVFILGILDSSVARYLPIVSQTKHGTDRHRLCIRKKIVKVTITARCS